MKYILIIPDGMADYPLKELENTTPLQVAKKPNMDFLNKIGEVGMVRTIPEGVSPGSDVAILSIMGYDPKKYYTGRGPLEAPARNVSLASYDVAFRCNLICSDGKTLIDYSGGHITTGESFVLMKKIAEKLDTEKIKFYPGISYRHLMKWSYGPENVVCIPPHDIIGEEIKKFLPKGDGEKILRNLIFNSIEILDKHEINKKRIDKGLNPANMIWLWGQGKKPKIKKFFDKYKIEGSVISAVDLIKGLAFYAGLESIEVPGATGYYDTNYIGKAEYALSSLEKKDFVFIHIEATDEAGHNADIQAKIDAIENIDKKIIGTILKNIKDEHRILILPDHFTPLSLRTHTKEDVPFLLYDSRNPKKQNLLFDEISAKETDLKITEGYKLMDLFISEK